MTEEAIQEIICWLCGEDDFGTVQQLEEIPVEVEVEVIYSTDQNEANCIWDFGVDSSDPRVYELESWLEYIVEEAADKLGKHTANCGIAYVYASYHISVNDDLRWLLIEEYDSAEVFFDDGSVTNMHTIEDGTAFCLSADGLHPVAIEEALRGD